MDDSVVNRHLQTRLEILALDHVWLDIGREPANWAAFLVRLREVRFLLHGDGLTQDVNWIRVEDVKDQMMTKLASEVAEEWACASEKWGPGYSNDYSQHGIDVSSRQPPKITA